MKGKEKLVILIVLVLLCASLVITLVVKNKNKDDDKEESETKTAEASTSKSYDSTTLPDDEIAKELMERVQDYDLLDTFDRTPEGLTNQQILAYAFFILNYEYDKDIPGSEIKTAIDKYFSVEYTNEDFECPVCHTRLYRYDAASDTYIHDPEHQGHTRDFGVSYNVIERYDTHSVEEDVYSITVYKAFTLPASNISLPEAYYGAYSGGAKLFEVEYDLTTEKTDIMGEFRKVDNAKLTKVTYKFVKNSEGILVLSARETE